MKRYPRWKVLLGCVAFVVLMGVVGHFEQEPAPVEHFDAGERRFARQLEEDRARAWLAYYADHNRRDLLCRNGR